jgi:hypothetical protein
VKADVSFYAQLQWIGPEDGIAAIQDGTTDGIGADFDYDRARAYDIISHIKMGPEALFNMPPEVVLLDVPVVDPATGMPAVDPATGVPVTRRSRRRFRGGCRARLTTSRSTRRSSRGG